MALVVTALASSGRRGAASPFAVVASVAVVAGGLVAAFTASVPSEHGAWVAAYLVLVVGVAQLVLGVGQAVLAPRVVPGRRVALELGGWNAGGAAVVAGTLLDAVWLVDVGGVLVVLALALLILGVREADRRRRGWLLAYYAFAGVLLVSVPTGLVLARI